jgi:hypothetical protein
MRSARSRGALCAALLALGGPALAGTADVVEARASCRAERCRFAVTVRHADTGWQHYANAFEVLGPDGEVLATRTLHHPHVDEQPFTRTLDARIPLAIERVTLRARDSRHGLGGAERELVLERRAE